MPTQPPIPPLLQPYLSTHQSSLTLLTSTLGTSTNWLLLRFIYKVLRSQTSRSSHDSDKTGPPQQNGPPRSTIVLVSWLRDATFWNDGARKLGIDSRELCIVDGLSTSLGIPHYSITDGPPAAASSSASTAVAAIEGTILDAIHRAVAPPVQKDDTGTPNTSSTLLILDGLDFLLAATAIPVPAIFDLLLSLRSRAQVHSTLVTAVADSPLIHSPTTPLETNHAALVMGMAHQASWVMSVRELDTGVARDVSGVLRITKGPGGEWDEEGQEGEDGNGDGEGRGEGEKVMVASRECLYFVGGDGGARVFERGA